MKKKGKMNKTTEGNFFISEFKLKSAEITREQQAKRLTTTLSHFKHQNMFQESRTVFREVSQDKKPVIEELKFISGSQEDFKIPKSMTKRSISKNSEN